MTTTTTRSRPARKTHVARSAAVPGAPGRSTPPALAPRAGRDGKARASRGTPAARRTSLEKMIEILDLFEADRLHWTPEQMMERLDCPRSTLYRYLRVLSNAGLVTSLPDIGYTLGPRIAELDYAMRASDPLITHGRALLKALTADIVGVGLLCRYYKGHVLCVHQEASTATEVHSSYERGRAMPIARGATSRVILAHLRLPQLRQVYEREADEFRRVGMGGTLDEALEALREIRKQGYCVTRGEVTPGVIGIAAPVFDSEGTVIGSLSMVVTDTGANERKRRLICDRVVFGASVLGSAMRRVDAG